MGRGKSENTMALVRAAREILQEIHPASVRAVAYRLFGDHLIASMAAGEVAKVSRMLSWARKQGWIEWDWIVESGRTFERVATWSSPADMYEEDAEIYREDYWSLQPRRVEVWSEKATVKGTLQPVLDELCVGFLPLTGRGSTTAVRKAVLRSRDTRARPLLVLYLGDYDPSGLAMSERDLPGRLEEFVDYVDEPGEIQFKRIALTEADTRALGEHPSFAASTKDKDPCYQWFLDRYGERCWELDALSPVTLRARVRRAIVQRIDDPEAWERVRLGEAEHQRSMRVYAESIRTLEQR